MARPASPTVRRRELANTLRALRVKSKMRLEDVAAHLEMSAATLSRIETGIRVPRARDVRDLAELYGVKGEDAAKIVDLVAEAKEPGWWEAYPEVDDDYATLIGLEAAASRIQQFEPTLVPGLVQTERYARAYLRDAMNPGLGGMFSSDEIEKLVEIRMRRQQVVFDAPGLTYEAIVDEASLVRPVGGRSVMQEQIRLLVDMAQRRSIDIRLLPLASGAHPGQLGGFTVITLQQRAVPDVVFLESPAGQMAAEEEPQGVRIRRAIWQVLHERALSESQTQEALLRMASDGVTD